MNNNNQENKANDCGSTTTSGSATNIDKARDFMVGFMKCEFADKTFENYIRKELAGDFVCELKDAITRITWEE